MYICPDMKRLYEISTSLAFFIAVWLFWWLAYPQALGFREQNQLFLFTWDFLLERLSVAGGLADWISEFITQFNVIPSLGAALIALLLTLIQLEVLALSGYQGSAAIRTLSFIPSILVLLHLGDIYTLLSFPVAIAIVLGLCLLYERNRSRVLAVAAVPTLLWLAGPAAWVFVVYVIIKERRMPALFLALIAVVSIWLQQALVLPQYPLAQTVLGINYYALPLEHPVLQHIIIASVLAIPALSFPLSCLLRNETASGVLLFVLLTGGGYAATYLTFDKDTYEIIAYDQLVRHEKWDEVVRRAEKYQPDSEIGCVSINLSLFMTAQYDRINDFRQCGTRGLLMPRVRDNISNISTGEAFWRMGMINEALRYAFDLQEAIPNLRKSPRFMMRITQCQMLNGRYRLALKYLDILSHTLFYRKWAVDQRDLLLNGNGVASDPVYAYLLSVRQNEDFLYYYPQMGNMLAKLYLHNRNNMMAAWYSQTWAGLQKDDENKETDTYSVHGD